MAEVLIIDNTEPTDTDYNDQLVTAIIKCGWSLSVIPYREAPDFAERIHKAQTIILSGVPFSYPLETAQNRQEYLGWLSTVQSPVLGICAGHQSIGLFFGATISGGGEIENGNCTIDIVLDDEIFKGLGRSFEIESVHWASIPVPSDFKQLARSRPDPQSIRGCENQVMVHKSKPIYGCQFHPEYSAKGRVFLNNFLNLT